jgi:hypothetical protein
MSESEHPPLSLNERVFAGSNISPYRRHWIGGVILLTSALITLMWIAFLGWLAGRVFAAW